jgi:hypothetical protein
MDVLFWVGAVFAFVGTAFVVAKVINCGEGFDGE